MRWFVRGLLAALLLCHAGIAGAGSTGPAIGGPAELVEC